MQNKAILVVSFGTSYDEARKKNIETVEGHIAQKFPRCKVYSAYTSGMVRAALKRRGIHIPSVSEALDSIQKNGFKQLIVQPTHLIYGEEYEKMKLSVSEMADNFESVFIGTPLLADFEDMEKVLAVLREGLAKKDGEALVLMGHGSRHFSNMAYAAMDYLAKSKGYEDVFIGTVEAFPDLDEVLAQVQKKGYKKALLTPLMLVAGDHAQNDMAGDDDGSWLQVFLSKGIETSCVLKGLGEYAGIREIYCEHIEKAERHEL